MELLKELVILTEDSGAVLNPKALIIARKVKKILGLETPTQSSLLSAFVDMFDDKHILPRNIASHFGIRTIEVLALLNELQFFFDREVIVRYNNDNGDCHYALSRTAIPALMENHLPAPRKSTNLTLEEFVDYCLELLRLIRCNNKEDEYIDKMWQLIDTNKHLPVAARLKTLELENTDLIFFFELINANLNEHMYSIGMCELTEYMRSGTARHLLACLTDGTHPLVKAELVEPFCANGQANMNEWTFSNESCENLLGDLKIDIPRGEKEKRSNLLHHEDIVAKELFFSDSVSRKITQLEELLDEKRMKQVMQHLSDRGMRRCFTCIMHGGPGTGKTETVLQLARRTGRDIMMVDLASIRDKWVGESEKHIKRIFDRYRQLAKDNALAPILCFNEADAIICKRNPDSSKAVDNMENAIQDIILGEMETLDGIMIATTNLVDNMDTAFERRFLYKIEFERPSATARKHIWKSMLPEISEDLAQRLANKYDFSGGEMENVTRKYTIDNIIHCNDEVDEELLFQLCQSERYSTKETDSVGFKVG